MKVQESLSQFLYETKKLTLPGLGHFTLDSAVNIYEKSDNELLQQAIQFTPDTREVDDPELISYLVKTTGKMRPLAMSDLESYLSTGQQLLNIGKPFILPGIGSIVKMREGLQFTPGQFIPPKLEDKVTEYKLRDKTIEEPNFSSIEREFDYEEGSRRTSRKWLMLLAGVLIIALAGWAVYYFFFKKNTIEPTTNATEEIIKPADTAAYTPALKPVDTLLTVPGSIAAIPDSISCTYAIALREYTYLKSAEQRKAQLQSLNYKVFVETKDSTHHNLLIPVNGLLADSTKVIDSLSRILLLPTSKRPQVRIKQ